MSGRKPPGRSDDSPQASLEPVRHPLSGAAAIYTIVAKAFECVNRFFNVNSDLLGRAVLFAYVLLHRRTAVCAAGCARYVLTRRHVRAGAALQGKKSIFV
jgi:hypothetical protein